ncbi:AQG_2a_G0049540.mRNA.1.CDS.1 [Saccharomyces cerevisiae]|nr:AQG_2a_G0049540.mRNA.1.CDS.1 [Saccharomyces cerevisiae]CAI7340302.1 AQG_2a_G0049540.mRNA.1.CDS.1 [Saccharomyces cerevisiae]
MSDSTTSPTTTFSTSLSPNATTSFFCGNMGVMYTAMSGYETEDAQAYWACGRAYESAFATLTKKVPGTTFSADMPTSTWHGVLDCGYSSSINVAENKSSPIDYWNCGRTYARNYALSDALSMKPTNMLQYFLLVLFFICIIL